MTHPSSVGDGALDTTPTAHADPQGAMHALTVALHESREEVAALHARLAAAEWFMRVRTFDGERTEWDVFESLTAEDYAALGMPDAPAAVRGEQS